MLASILKDDNDIFAVLFALSIMLLSHLNILFTFDGRGTRGRSLLLQAYPGTELAGAYIPAMIRRERQK